MLDKIKAEGHQNIRCTHETTIEITKDSFLTKRGNCILGINASKSCVDLNEELKREIKSGKKIKVTIKFGEFNDIFYGYGDKRLSLSNERAMVFRKSTFICDRTVLIRCNKSSKDINRKLLNNLKTPEHAFYLIFELAE